MRSCYSRFVHYARKFKSAIKQHIPWVARHRYYILAAAAITVVGLAGALLASPAGWVVKSSIIKSRTYPYATVMGLDAGNLNQDSLVDVLAKAKQQFEAERYTVRYQSTVWRMPVKDLGFAINTNQTKELIWRLNDLSLDDKAHLIRERKNNRTNLEPVVSVNSTVCQQKITAIMASINKEPINAELLFDGQLKVKPDKPGVSLNAVDTCHIISQSLRSGNYTSGAAVKSVAASLTQADITGQLERIRGMAGRSLTFTNNAYRRVVDPTELLSFLVLQKEPGKPLAVTWDNTKLSALAAEMATHINTTTTPHVSTCEVLVSPGGTKLDQQSVVSTITSQDAGKPTSYKLQTYAVAPKIRNRSVATGANKGTVYLTYDDGMAYAGTIMDYAACYNIKVTFFEIGSLASTDAPQLRRAIAEGHAVQSHGYIHAVYDYGTGHDYAWQLDDISHSIDVITSITGVRPTYFRPPGGNRTADTRAAATANGVKMILWDVSSVDTSNNTSADICKNVVNGATAGDSVLMHSSKQKTANALPCIVEGLAARGYTMQALR